MSHKKPYPGKIKRKRKLTIPTVIVTTTDNIEKEIIAPEKRKSKPIKTNKKPYVDTSSSFEDYLFIKEKIQIESTIKIHNSFSNDDGSLSSFTPQPDIVVDVFNDKKKEDNTSDIDLLQYDEKTPLITNEKRRLFDYENVKYYPFKRSILYRGKRMEYKKGSFRIIGRITTHPKIIFYYLAKKELINSKFKNVKTYSFDDLEKLEEDEISSTQLEKSSNLMKQKNILLICMLFIPIVNLFVLVYLLVRYVNSLVAVPLDYSFMIHSKFRDSKFKGLFFSDRQDRKFRLIKRILEYDRKIGVLNYKTVCKILKLSSSVVEMHWNTAQKDVKKFYESVRKALSN